MILRRSGTFLLGALLVAANLPAQVIRGTVGDVVGHQPLVGATVAILDAKDSALRTTVTSNSGRFSVTLPGGGAFVIDVRLVGYIELTTTSAEVGVGDTVTIDLQLAAAAPVTLDTVRTTAMADSSFLSKVTPGHVVLQQHYKLGKGIFVGGFQLEKSGMTMTEYLGRR